MDVLEFIDVIKADDDEAKISIVSGFSSVLVDGSYKITKKEVGPQKDEVRQILFNKAGDLHQPQDTKKVRSVPHKVEGTIISGVFKLNKEYLNSVVKSKAQ